MAYEEDVEKRFKHFGVFFGPVHVAYKLAFDTTKNLFVVVAVGVLAKKGQSEDINLLYKILSGLFAAYIGVNIYRLLLSVIPQSINIVIRLIITLVIIGPSFLIIGSGLSYVQDRVLDEIISLQVK